MDLHPWDFWTKKGEAQPWTPEIVSILETVLRQAPNHPLVNHLYIHTIEASPYPEKRIPSAERLAGLVAGSGHLVHMPAHIYIRVGRYRDAATANQQAVKVDKITCVIHMLTVFILLRTFRIIIISCGLRRASLDNGT